jgi:hypothetical protein
MIKEEVFVKTDSLASLLRSVLNTQIQQNNDVTDDEKHIFLL